MEKPHASNAAVGHSMITVPAQPMPRAVDLWLAFLSSAMALRIALATVFGIGTFLRLWQLNAVGYNSDEAVYAGQGAALAGDPQLSKFFPIFRAHPMLFQSLLALIFKIFGAEDIYGRLASVGFGVATLFLVFLLGRMLYGPWTGVLAALMMSVMPYHVVVTRQVLLDGPMVFFTTLSLYLITRFAQTEQPRYLYATGAALGMVFLAKETGFVVFAACYAFLALSPQFRVRIRDIAISFACIFVTVLPFPISVTMAGRSSTAKGYMIWQLFRRPNHTWDFYPTVVPPAIGLLVLGAAVAGVVLLWRHRSWRETLLFCWIGVPIVVFQLWPVKGFQYLLPIAPAVAILAARAIVKWTPRTDSWLLQRKPRLVGGWWIRPLIVGIVVLSLVVPSWDRVQPPQSTSFLAGSGGVIGGREAGAWIDKYLPEDALFLTVGPSMANIIQFYGNRRAYGISVSPNPLHRNPSYEAVLNPDARIRNSELQYLVYDTFSASRSPFFGEKLLTYAEKYHGRIVHQEVVTVRNADGSTTEKPVIVIYEVRGDV